MARNHHNKKSAPQTLTQFPPAADPHAALDWWREKIRAGFPPLGAADNLHELAGRTGDPELKRQFHALERAADQAVLPDRVLVGSPHALTHLACNPERTLAFIASATGGITCHNLKDGSLRWKLPAERAFQVGGLAIGESVLYYSDSWNGRLHAVAAADGKELWCSEATSDGAPLLAPAGIALLEQAGTVRLLVCDSSGHRLCSFAIDGTPLDAFGVRGLVSEETAHLNTAPPGADIPPCFEYPRTVSIAADSDGKDTVFVWDSGNIRVAVLDIDLKRKRNIPLVAEHEIKPRLAGQVQVVSGPSGPVVLVVDDTARTLAIRGVDGELLLTLDMSRLSASGNRTLEIARIESGAGGSAPLLIAAGNGKLFKLGAHLLDIRALAAGLLNAFPENGSLVTAAAAGISDIESWQQVSPALDPSALVRGLCGSEKPYGELTTAAGRLWGLVGLLENSTLTEEGATLRQALNSQLEELHSACLVNLERLSTPSMREIESWSDALCELDMEVFQTHGRSSSAELTLDVQLEQVRELRPAIRRCGWRLREVDRLLLQGDQNSKIHKYAGEMVKILSRLLDRRLDTLCSVAGRLEYGRDPQRVNRQELQTAHAARLNVSAIEGATVELAGELVRLLTDNAIILEDEFKARLGSCLEKSSGLACYSVLSGIAAAKSVPELSLPANPELNDSAGDKLNVLVDKMGSYLQQVQDSENGPQFGKVLERQKNLFSVKASVLANYYQVNGHGRELLERARRLSGNAWDENRNLRPAVEVGS